MKKKLNPLRISKPKIVPTKASSVPPPSSIGTLASVTLIRGDDLAPKSLGKKIAHPYCKVGWVAIDSVEWLDKDAVLDTQVCERTLSPQWQCELPKRMRVPAGCRLMFEVWSANVLADDYMGWTCLDAAFLLSVANKGVTVDTFQLQRHPGKHWRHKVSGYLTIQVEFVASPSVGAQHLLKAKKASAASDEAEEGDDTATLSPITEHHSSSRDRSPRMPTLSEDEDALLELSDDEEYASSGSQSEDAADAPVRVGPVAGGGGGGAGEKGAEADEGDGSNDGGVGVGEGDGVEVDNAVPPTSGLDAQFEQQKQRDLGRHSRMMRVQHSVVPTLLGVADDAPAPAPAPVGSDGQASPGAAPKEDPPASFVKGDRSVMEIDEWPSSAWGTNSTPVQWRLYNGLVMRGTLWGSRTLYTHRVLALPDVCHNAASFSALAPALVQALGYEEVTIVALDLLGQGQSDWRHLGDMYHPADDVAHVMEVVQHLNWDRFHIVGHGAGAGIGCIIAGTFPDRVSSLMMLDRFGPPVTSAQKVRERLAKFVDNRDRIFKDRATVFPNLRAAIDCVRKECPWASDLSPGALQRIAKRNTKIVKRSKGKVISSVDPRRAVVRCPAPITWSEDQVWQFLAAIRCPSMLLYYGAKQYPPGVADALKARSKCCRTLRKKQLDAQHPLHHLTDPKVVVKEVVSLIGGNKGRKKRKGKK